MASAFTIAAKWPTAMRQRRQQEDFHAEPQGPQIRDKAEKENLLLPSLCEPCGSA